MLTRKEKHGPLGPSSDEQKAESFRDEMGFGQTVLRCKEPRCQSINTVCDEKEGQIVCADCGVVFKTRLLDDETTIRPFSPDLVRDPSSTTTTVAVRSEKVEERIRGIKILIDSICFSPAQFSAYQGGSSDAQETLTATEKARNHRRLFPVMNHAIAVNADAKALVDAVYALDSKSAFSTRISYDGVRACVFVIIACERLKVDRRSKDVVRSFNYNFSEQELKYINGHADRVSLYLANTNKTRQLDDEKRRLAYIDQQLASLVGLSLDPMDHDEFDQEWQDAAVAAMEMDTDTASVGAKRSRSDSEQSSAVPAAKRPRLQSSEDKDEDVEMTIEEKYTQMLLDSESDSEFQQRRKQGLQTARRQAAEGIDRLSKAVKVNAKRPQRRGLLPVLPFQLVKPLHDLRKAVARLNMPVKSTLADPALFSFPLNLSSEWRTTSMTARPRPQSPHSSAALNPLDHDEFTTDSKSSASTNRSVSVVARRMDCAIPSFFRQLASLWSQFAPLVCRTEASSGDTCAGAVREIPDFEIQHVRLMSLWLQRCVENLLLTAERPLQETTTNFLSSNSSGHGPLTTKMQYKVMSRLCRCWMGSIEPLRLNQRVQKVFEYIDSRMFLSADAGHDSMAINGGLDARRLQGDTTNRRGCLVEMLTKKSADSIAATVVWLICKASMQQSQERIAQTFGVSTSCMTQGRTVITALLIESGLLSL